MANDEPEKTDYHDGSPSFAELMDRLQAGDKEAARSIHERYTQGLVALACRQLASCIRGKVDPESIVQSVFRSFFQRQRDNEFPSLGDWDDLWGLLTVITLRKCANRWRFHHQARRDIRREVPAEPLCEGIETSNEPIDPGPTPEDAAALSETLEQLLGDLLGREREIIERLLQGHTIEEVRRQVGCGERTVRRVRDRVRQKLRRIGLGAPSS